MSFGAKGARIGIREDLGTEDGNQGDDTEAREAFNLAVTVLFLAISALFLFAGVLFFLWLIRRT